MKVYELIQELARFNADSEVTFHVDATRTMDVEAEFDREEENNVQDVTVDAEIDDDFDFDYTYGREDSARPSVTINLN